MTPKTKNTIQSVENVFQIIDYIQERGGSGISEIKKEIDLSASTIHRYLSTLEELEYVINNNGSYHLGLRILTHGMSAKAATGLPPIVRPALSEITDSISQVPWFLIEEHGDAVFLEKGCREANNRSYGRISKRTPIHSHAGGKAILAHLTADEVEAIINSQGLIERTEETVTDKDELFDQLREIRERGFAISEGEEAVGIRCVGVPVIVDDIVVGSVCVFGMKYQMTGEYFHKEVPKYISEAATQIESRLSNNEASIA